MSNEEHPNPDVDTRASADSTVEARGDEADAPERIGPYKLLQKIGEGGFGSVFMAEQERPVRRRVALKIIKLGMDTRQVVARFEAERQALAMMDHPNIAKVFDAGAAPSGRPYFVMELVRGVPITEYCDTHRLGTHARLDLFMAVCHAIQHAHQKGVIHRDIKPSNILVAMHDAKPVPKVIDFGIAKATDHRLTERTLFTEYHQLIGTPEYMSPEQAEATGLDVDTRTDVYSLGVLLYQLLTGALPFSREELQLVGYDAMRKTIRENEPLRPSTRLTMLGSTAAQVGTRAGAPNAAGAVQEIARRRGTDPVSLRKQIRGDLDWITMRALEKDRTRRYGTASELAADVERHLQNDPVLAGPPSVTYRLSKFLKKHRTGVSVAAAFAVLLMAGLFSVTRSYVRAERALAEARDAHDSERAQRTEAEHRKEEADRQRDAARAAEARAEHLRREAELHAYIGNVQAAHAALGFDDVVVALRRLERCAPELRNWEWRYLKARSDLSLVTLDSEQGVVFDLAFSPDGTRLATAGYDGTAKVWDLARGEEILILGKQDEVSGVAFSPDGRYLATAGENVGTLFVWSLESGEKAYVLPEEPAGVSCVAFSPDGKLLASATHEGFVRLHDWTTGTEVLRKRGTSIDSVRGLAFSSDGAFLALCGEDETVRLWNARSGEERWVRRDHEDIVYAVCFSPDGTRLASSSRDGAVRLWDTADGTPLQVLRGHGGAVADVTFSPDGARLASASWDHTIKLWDATTGNELRTLRGHVFSLYTLAFSPDGARLVSGDFSGNLKIWDVRHDDELPTLRGRSGAILGVAFSPDGTRLASAGGWELRVWDANLGAPVFSLEVETELDSIKVVAYSPDGTRLACAGSGNSVKLRDAETGEEVGAQTGHEKKITAVAFSPDGARLASASWDRTVRIWDVARAEELLVLRGHTGRIYGLAYSPDGARLVTGSRDQTVILWDANRGEPLKALRGPVAQVRAVAYNPNGSSVAAAFDNMVKIWNADSGAPLLELHGHTSSIMELVFSHDGSRLATAGNDHTVRIWDTARGEELLTLRGHSDTIYALAFSADSSRLASAGQGGAVRLWDTIAPGLRAAAPALPTVNAWFDELGAPADVLRRLHADISLTPAFRAAAETAVLVRSAALRAEAGPLVERLLDEVILVENIVARLRDDTTLSAPLRHAAIHLARARKDDPNRMNSQSWRVVRDPDRDPRSYQKALRLAREASRLRPDDGTILNTLGVAQFRVGRYAEALTTLRRSDELNNRRQPDDAAFLALTLHKLGRSAEAQAEVKRLQAFLSDWNPNHRRAATTYLREVESVLGPISTQPAASPEP